MSILSSFSQTYIFRRFCGFYCEIVDIGALSGSVFNCSPGVFTEKGVVCSCSCIIELFDTSSANQHE